MAELESLTPLVERTGTNVNPWEGTDYAFRIVIPRDVMHRFERAQRDE